MIRLEKGTLGHVLSCENCRNKHEKKGLQGSLYNVGNKIRELVYLFSRDDLMSKDFKLHYLF